MRKNLIKLFSIVLVALLLFGCSKDTKTFEEDDFKITVEGDFKKDELAGFTYYYESSDVIVTALKESFTSLKSLGVNNETTLEEYTKLILTSNNKEEELKTRNDYMYFEYTSTVDGDDFYYIAATYKSDDAFWLINFMCMKSDKNKFKEKFLSWADTVEL